MKKAIALLLVALGHLVLPFHTGLAATKILAFELPLAAALLWVFATQPKDLWFTWLRRGEMSQLTIWLAISTATLSIPTLLAWASWTDNLGACVELGQKLQALPGWLAYGVCVPLIATLNAAVEEVVYRGVIQDALTWVFRSPLAAIMLQASVFAAAHVAAGFPNGLTGYVLCFAFAVPLGVLRWRTGGLLVPVLVHIVADLTIGYLLCANARS